MTVLDIRNQIVEKFCRKSTLSFDDFEALSVPQEFEGAKFGLAMAALEELTEIGMVHHVEPDDDSEPFWILSAPIGASGQNVHLELSTLEGIASIINSFLEANEIEDTRADALNIGERDILMLIGILGDILDVDPDAKKDAQPEDLDPDV